MVTESVYMRIKNEWLADMLTQERDQITERWIRIIRAENLPDYDRVTDEQMRQEFPPTVDSMIYAFRTGDLEGPRRHSISVISRRLAQGFRLPDLQRSLHALEAAVMEIVHEADLGPVKEFEALTVASSAYYMVALIAAEVYEHLRVEQQRRFTAAYELGATLNGILDLQAVLDTAVRKVAEYTGGQSVVILLAKPGGQRDEVRAYHDLDEKTVKAMPGICKSIGCGAQDIEVTDMRENACAVPDVRKSERLKKQSDVLVSHGHLSMVCVPLQARRRRSGSLVILRREAHATSNAEMDFLSAMAGHIANAVQNAILYEEARGKRELGILLDASRLFASSLDLQDLLNKIARMATEAVRADLAVVFMPDRPEEQSYQVAHYAVNVNAQNAVRKIMQVLVDSEVEVGYGGFVEGFADGRFTLIDNYAEYPGRLPSLVGTIGSILVVPLKFKGPQLGIFALVSLDQSAFSETDLTLATGLADLAAVAIENAKIYEYERRIAETLQRSFLPSSLPTIGDYEIGAYYRPGMAEAEIGGDFYDVFPAGEDITSIIIADVSGKGLQAAVQTAMGKYVIRAYVVENPSPGSVLARLNRTYYEYGPEGRFMTTFCGMLDPVRNTLTYASAGRDPPLMYSAATGQVMQLVTGGIALGVVPAAEYEDRMIRLRPGDVLLLYTDGATDVKEDGKRLGIDGLRRLFRRSVHEPAGQIVHNVFDGIRDFGLGRFPDDIALVVLKRRVRT